MRAQKPKARVLVVGEFDMGSPDTLARFRAAAAAYTAAAVKTQASAIKTLQREGMLARSGKPTKIYSAG